MNTVLVKDDYLSKRTNTRIFFEEEISEQENQNRQLAKRKLMYAMRKREEEAQNKYNEEHRNGYCPHCHMLIPMSGKCDCGYEVK
jgi:type IV secretory pathway VirD2 relaxase